MIERKREREGEREREREGSERERERGGEEGGKRQREKGGRAKERGKRIRLCSHTLTHNNHSTRGERTKIKIYNISQFLILSLKFIICNLKIKNNFKYKITLFSLTV